MVSDTISEADEQRDARRAWVRLNNTRRDLLAAVGAFDTAPSGQEVKGIVQSESGKEWPASRLYPNLDELADAGLLAKGHQNKRTNEYALTTWGERVLNAGADRLDEVRTTARHTEGER